MATPKLFSLTLLAASALAISTPALAAEKSKTVQYADLDLSTATGQERLKTRVRQAVKMVCSSPRALTLDEKIDQNKCKADATAKATAQVEQRIAAYIDSRRFASRDGAVVVGN